MPPLTILRLLPLLLAAGLLAPAAEAQAPHALNAPPLPSAEADRLAAFEARLGHAGGTPDTTAPWRYFPLAVGNVWEYESEVQWRQRWEIEKDTLAFGRRYAVLHRQIHNGATVTLDFRELLRYDTTAAIVQTPRLDGVDVPALFPPCRLDLPFDDEVECDGFEVYVTGGYDGAVVFGGDTPGTGTDTVHTAVKSYYTNLGIVSVYAADVGEVYEGGEGGFWALTYYRNEEEEHGVSQWPVANEQGPPSGEEAMTISAWPNPTRGPLTLGIVLARPADLTLDVVDPLGRRVLTRTVGRLPPGAHRLPLDLGALPRGPYLLRLRDAAGHGVTRSVTVTR